MSKSGRGLFCLPRSETVCQIGQSPVFVLWGSKTVAYYCEIIDTSNFPRRPRDGHNMATCWPQDGPRMRRNAVSQSVCPPHLSYFRYLPAPWCLSRSCSSSCYATVSAHHACHLPSPRKSWARTYARVCPFACTHAAHALALVSLSVQPNVLHCTYQEPPPP